MIREVDFSKEITCVREQLTSHYEAQIRTLLKEIVCQKDVLEFTYKYKFD